MGWLRDSGEDWSYDHEGYMVYQDDMDGPIHLCDEHMLMLQREDEIENAGHRMGVEQVYWDNLGGGWRMDCLCGWTTVPCDQLVGAAEEMELHWELERSGG